MSQHDRTEKATPKRREDARKKGNIARGADIPAAFSFLAALAAMSFFGRDINGHVRHLFVYFMAHATDNPALTPVDVHILLLEAAKSLGMIVLPIIGIAWLAGLAGNFAQGGLTLTTEVLVPKADRFNPANNIKKIFSGDSVGNLVKTILKAILLAAVSYGTLSSLISESASLLSAPVTIVINNLVSHFFALGWRVGFLLLMLALLDYGYVWYKFEKSIKMTKQEIKDEFKEQEGDPRIKGQRRRVARALMQKRSLLEVPKATVVITNPTHFAVALRYDREKDAAPVLVAKGQDEIARKIREIAQEAEVPLVENPPLARAIYKTTEIGKLIPIELFSAVAEVLAYVYRKNNRANYT
jgi:flagellar biosynthetic protein FlhB